jgi:hypothetical protein
MLIVMSRGNYLDIKTIKKHAKELRRNLTQLAAIYPKSVKI